MKQLAANSFNTVGSITFVLYKSHIIIYLLQCAMGVLNIIIIIIIMIISSYLIGCSIMFSSIICQVKPRLASYRGLINPYCPTSISLSFT